MMKLILASKSPRRQELLKQMGYTFEVRTKEVDESFPAHLTPMDAAIHIAGKKAAAFKEERKDDEIVIVADTIVTIDQKIIGKPVNRNDAINTLALLSGRVHEVITAVGLVVSNEISLFVEVTKVHMAELTQDEIEYYTDQFKPYDKAGAYGIQEWIGLVGITRLEGTYTNVVGLPTARLFRELRKLL
ncbi:septum formation protein [bacterium A37T11]|nr:septum formation protein [bacterium A37T11]